MHNINASENNTENYLRGAGLALNKTSSETRSHDANAIQDNIFYINASSAQRNRANNPPESSTSRDSAAPVAKIVPYFSRKAVDNRHVGNRTDTPVTSQSAVLNASDIVRSMRTEVNNKDPLQKFILKPGYKEAQSDLFDAIACKNLPLFFRNTKFDWPSQQGSNMPGIISEDIQPEDRKLFNKCCVELTKANNVYYDEIKVGKKIGYLVHKYGEAALNRHIDTFTECCIKVWGCYNPRNTSMPSRNDILLMTQRFVTM